MAGLRPLACSALALAGVGIAALPSVASAERIAAITPGGQLLLFDSAMPTATGTRTITGLPGGEAIRGIDYRPATNEVYVVTASAGFASNSVAKTYAVAPSIGPTALVGSTAGTVPGWADVAGDLDFNPVADRIRLVNVNDENFRVNPNNGALAGDDADLAPASTTALIGVAYDRNVVGSTATTAFAIDRSDSELATLGGVDGTPSPNSGAVTDIGPLGVTLTPGKDGGFDISGATGTAYAALTDSADGLTHLYSVNLTTGATTNIGLVGNGTSEIYGMTVLPAPPAGPGGPGGPPGPTGP